MNVYALQYTPYQNTLMSENNFDLLNNGPVNIWTDSSYNTDNFRPNSIEFDATQLRTVSVVTFDGYAFNVNPGDYIMRGIKGVSYITITGKEVMPTNFYKDVQKEVYRNSYVPNRLITTNFYRRNGNIQVPLSIVYQAAGAIFNWNAANDAPFNVVQDIRKAIKSFAADARRLHLSFGSSIIYPDADGVHMTPVGMWYSFTDFGTNPSGNGAVFLPAGTYNYDNPMSTSEVWMALDTIAPIFTVPANGQTFTIGQMIVENYGN